MEAPMSIPKRQRTLHLLFLASVWIKGVAGIAETLAGAILPFVSQKTLLSLVILLTAPELAEDPDDWLANYVSRAIDKYSSSTQSFASAYLIIHGLIKVILVASLLWGRNLWVYAASMWALIAFIAYQMWLYSRTPSLWLILLTVLDLVVIYLVWREYQWRSQSTPATR
jgi:uncharacterized membrane protein